METELAPATTARFVEAPLVIVVAPSDISVDLGQTVLWRDRVRRVMVGSVESAARVAALQPPKMIVLGTGAIATTAERVRWLRCHAATHDVAIAALVTSTHFEDEQALRSAGASVVLPVPVDAALWDSRLDELLDVPRRRDVRISVRFSVWSPGEDAPLAQGTALNLSLRGLLIETEEPLVVGMKLDLAFHLPGRTRELAVVAQVVRVVAGPKPAGRAGIEFLVLRGDARERLSAFIEGRRSAAHAARTPPPEASEWEQELRASEARKAAIVESALDCIITMDHEGRIREFNRAAELTFGYARSAVVGRTVAETIVPPALRDGHRRDLDEFVSTTAGTSPSRRFEMMAMRADGSQFLVEVALTALALKGRRLFTAYIRDMTDRLAREESLRQSRSLEEQLRQAQKMEAVGRLAGGIAHDFNNLLGVILGYAGLALRRADQPDEVRRTVEEIRRAGDRAAGLTHQLLAFSRKQVLMPEVLDLRACVTDIERMLATLLGEDVEMACELAPDAGCVAADPGQIQQVVMNLAVNARDAMTAGGRLRIAVRNIDLGADFVREHVGSRPGPHVVLEVTDSGVGMDAVVMGRIFEPFFTTKDPGKGTGLGLATVYGIVKQSGGYVEAESAPGAGATFRVYLPRVEETPVASGAPASEVGPSGSETILVVEDDPALRALVGEILEGGGYRVLDARNGEEAVRLSRGLAEKVDLLLTDVVMPGMSGRVLADTLVTEREGLRVLYASGYTDDAIIRHGVLDPGTAFIQKPFTAEQLMRRVREALRA